MGKTEEELEETKNSSRKILVFDILGCAILLLLMLFFRNKFMPIFKEMKVAPTLAGKIMFETHPFVIFIGFMAIATILILKERVIKNKTVTYFFNSIVLIVLILLILYFLLGAFIPLFDTPITSLRGNG